MDNKQKILLRIVQSWNLKHKPEYRGFRCANCQKHMHKAWHYWCVSKDYKTPVHFCNKCESDFKSLKLNIAESKKMIDKEKFELKSVNLEKRLGSIIKNWNTKTKPIYKTFTCDYCAESLHKAYHFWLKFKKNNTLFEAHFCKRCGDKAGLIVV